MYEIIDNRNPTPAFTNAYLMADSYRVVDNVTFGTIGLVVPFPGAVRHDEWRRTVLLMNAAPDLKQALRDLMDDYASHLGVPVEACDKGNFAQAWSALRKSEGAA
jgi:hypothetical protein